VMLEAQERMFDALRGHTLATIAGDVDNKTTAKYAALKQQWFDNRDAERRVPARLRSKTKGNGT